MQRDERYELVIGSDGDGTFLEMWGRTPPQLALWAFFSDVDGSFEFVRYLDDVPAEIEAWFRQEARRRLPPKPDA